jgi:C4-dicarboxylate-specific signal transduction histidine kinase
MYLQEWDMNNSSTILVVDDDAKVLQVMVEILEYEGFNVMPALSGRIALDAINKSLPDLILLDILMPDIDGYEVCRRLKADKETLSIPVIFVSGKDEVQDKCDAFDVGGVDYVTKPFHRQELLARVRTHLQLARMEDLKREINERTLAELALQLNEFKLQSANEELQAQNEELQLQSEELQAQSEELQVQSEELNNQNLEMLRLWEINKKSEDTLRKSAAELQSINTELLNSRRATMNMMQDAIISRNQAEEMSHKLQHEVDVRTMAEVKLKQMNDDLEKLVDVRTYELKNTLETLKAETVERINTMETLREKERMLIQQSRQAALGEMIGNIAHQWRQPLNTLGLYTQSLGVFYGAPNFNKELLDNAIAKSMNIIKHMSKTIDDFRDYFRPEKEKADFYVTEAIKSTLSLLEGNFHNPKITVDFVEHDNPVINGYQNEFAQVFLNILNNARDAIIERVIVDARIIITISSENDCAVVTVADNAGGIPDEIIGKVFDPYFTTKGPQSGTGIGLFMSKSIIEKNMGGKLTVRNTDTGAEFRIEVGKCC